MQGCTNSVSRGRATMQCRQAEITLTEVHFLVSVQSSWPAHLDGRQLRRQAQARIVAMHQRHAAQCSGLRVCGQLRFDSNTAGGVAEGCWCSWHFHATAATSSLHMSCHPVSLAFPHSPCPFPHSPCPAPPSPHPPAGRRPSGGCTAPRRRAPRSRRPARWSSCRPGSGRRPPGRKGWAAWQI